MLNKATTLTGYTLHSLDGDIGSVTEFYFDDQYWTIRYLVADTGNWLPDRQVLISPHTLISVDKEKRQIAVNLTRQQIEAQARCRPPTSPVSRRRIPASDGSIAQAAAIPGGHGSDERAYRETLERRGGTPPP